MANGYGNAYSQAYQKAAVSTIDQRKMIIMLYDGAIKFLSIAVEKLAKPDLYAAHTNMVRGKSIIAELLASLNLEDGGEIAVNLQRLYAYMFGELIDANLEKDPQRIVAVIELLKELRSGWQAIGPEAERKAAQSASSGNSRNKHISVRG
ncbi:MAG: flagellar export chaperone FliS [Candidatus Lambdaproteobacteria bacterium]|nr:flagellar export chaperone FliS [Candidatus Lambdaproteobacteria bacterium]